MSTGWNGALVWQSARPIINLLGNEYWLEHIAETITRPLYYKPTGK